MPSRGNAGLVFEPRDLVMALDKPQQRLLWSLSSEWLGVGTVAAVWYGARCVADAGATLAMDIPWCVELVVFGLVCWILLALILGFPLYYWLVQQNRRYQRIDRSPEE